MVFAYFMLKHKINDTPMKNTYFTILPKALLTIAIGIFLSVNASAQDLKSMADIRNGVTENKARDSREWTVAIKHIDTKSITTYTVKNEQELIGAK